MAVKRIKDVMTTGVISVSQEDKIQNAINVMTDRNISCVIVTENKESKKPVGIITERDLIRRVLKTGKDPKKVKAKDIMTKSMVSISEEASLDEGMRVIENMRIRRLPVLSNKEIVGLVTQSDIVHETHNLSRHNRTLTLHQTIQSYVIIGLAVVFVVAFIIRIWF